MTRKKTTFEIGQRLSAVRLKRGLSQGTVARRAGMAASYLSRIENGNVQPTFVTVLRLAEAMGIRLEEIQAPTPRRNQKSGPCPITPRGQCLLDLIHADSAQEGALAPDRFTVREVRVLRKLAHWMKHATPDRLRAMEIILDDLTGAGEK